jgi:hypothetical protein
MTKRDFLNAVKTLEGCTDEMREVADKMIAQLDKKSSKPTKVQLENEKYKADIADFMGEDAYTAKEIAEGVGISTNKAAALLRQMDGIEKIPGAKSKDAPRYRKAE